MGNLNWVDAALALLIGLNAALGVRRGIFREAFNLFGILAGLFAGLRLYEALGWSIEGWLDAKPEVANLIAFVAVFLVITFGSSYVGLLLHKGAKRLFVGWFDRLLGGAFGFGRGLIFASVAALVVALFPLTPRVERDLATSVLGPRVIKIAPAVYGTVMAKLRGRGYEGLDVKKLIDEYAAAPGAAATAEISPGDGDPEEK
jgi:membrane protein required for colicin V production